MIRKVSEIYGKHYSHSLIVGYVYVSAIIMKQARDAYKFASYGLGNTQGVSCGREK